MAPAIDDARAPLRETFSERRNGSEHGSSSPDRIPDRDHDEAVGRSDTVVDVMTRSRQEHASVGATVA
jgi:hypothetical protein